MTCFPQGWESADWGSGFTASEVHDGKLPQPIGFLWNIHADQESKFMLMGNAVFEQSRTPSEPNVDNLQIDRSAELVKEGVKLDTGKDPWHLAPWDAFGAIIKVLAFGATKYAPRNWEKGMAWSRLYSALMRHLVSWWGGEKADTDTGYSHLWHAGACVLFLIAYEIRGIGEDDRPKG